MSEGTGGEPERAAGEAKTGVDRPGRSRPRSKWGPALAGLGALSLIAAAILHWVVLPDRKEMPADTNTVRQFEGTAKVLLNPQAVATGNLASALAINVPVTAQRQVKALATDGDVAQVEDIRVLNANGATVGRSDVKYAVDRKTLEEATNYPSDWPVVSHQGLTVSWPIGAEKKGYTAWINDTKTTTPVTYVSEADKSGLNTYVYEANSTAAPITDPAVLDALPKALPGNAVKALATSLPLPDELKQGLAALLPQLGDPVPLTYTYEVKSKYWVEPTTGLVVDTSREEIRKAVISARGTPVGSVPIYDVETHFTPASITEATNDAEDKRNSIDTYGNTLPAWLTGAGIVALLGGLFLMLRKRPSPQTAPAQPATGPVSEPPPPTRLGDDRNPPATEGRGDGTTFDDPDPPTNEGRGG